MTGDSLEYTEQLIRFYEKLRIISNSSKEFQDVSFSKKNQTRNLKR